MSAISYYFVFLSVFMTVLGIGKALPLAKGITERRTPVTTIVSPPSLSESTTVGNVTWKLTINVPGFNFNGSHARPEQQQGDESKASMRTQNDYIPEESFETGTSEISTPGNKGSVDMTSVNFAHGDLSINSSNPEGPTKNSSMGAQVDLQTQSTVVEPVNANLSVIHFFEKAEPETTTDAQEQNSSNIFLTNSSEISTSEVIENSNLSVIHFFEKGEPETTTEQFIGDAPVRNSSNVFLMNTSEISTSESIKISNLSVIHFFEKGEPQTTTEQFVADAQVHNSSNVFQTHESEIKTGELIENFSTSVSASEVASFSKNHSNFSNGIVHEVTSELSSNANPGKKFDFGKPVTEHGDVFVERSQEATFESARLGNFSAAEDSNFPSQKPLPSVATTDSVQLDIESLAVDGSGFSNEAFGVTPPMLPATKLDTPTVEDGDKSSDAFADVHLQNPVTEVLAANVSEQVTRPECPAPGVCLLWFMAQDTCAVDSHCLGTRICCKIRCSKTCVDV